MTIELKPLPMEEAQQFWNDKVKLGPGEFGKLADEAKLRAFAVSGIAKGDELNTVFTALQRAIDSGTSFDDFKKECGDIFLRRGWTGKRAWRVDNIFRTNIQTAYNVGHYKQLMADRDVFPYWQYSAINDSRTRPTHLAMDGRVWPADHPVWDTWFPPNGYRCRCSVIGLTRGQAKASGIKVEHVDPTNRLIEPIDQASGNRMPARPLIPDPGFKHNPGKVYWQQMAGVMTDRLEQYPQKLSTLVLKDLLAADGFARFLKNPVGDFPVLRLRKDAAEAINSKAGVAVFSKDFLLKNLRNYPGLTVEDYRLLPLLGERPDMIIKDSGKTVALLKKGGRWFQARLKYSGKALRVTSYRQVEQKDVDELLKTGRLIFRKKG